MPQQVKARRHREMRREWADQLPEINLTPVDGGDHRPQDEREIARLSRAIEQTPDQLGPDEGVLMGRVSVHHRRRSGLGSGARSKKERGHELRRLGCRPKLIKKIKNRL